MTEPHIILSEMDRDQINKYTDYVKSDFALETARAYGWDAAQAEAYSHKMIDAELANKNSRQYFCHIRTKVPDEIVGGLWYAIEPEGETWRAYLFMINIDPRHQKKGYAFHAVKQLEQHVSRQHGIHRIYLNVFDFNQPARGLYKKLGFEPVSARMFKDIQS